MRNKIGFLILAGLVILIVSAFINFHVWEFIKNFFYPEKIINLEPPLNQELINEIRAQIDSSRTWHAIATLVTVIFSLTVIFIATVIILENRNPSITLSWLLVLLFIPVLGLIFYLTFGRNYRKKKLVKDKEILNDQLNELVEQQMHVVSNEFSFSETHSINRLVKLILKSSNSPFTKNNTAKVLTNGEETFSEIIEELKKAKNHIHLEYYIIQDDEIGHKIKDILVERACSGVEVRVIYDGVGSRKLSLKYITQLKNAGVKVKCFLPVVMPFLNSKINYRNHRKIIVIDGKVGFVGGLNIGDEYLGKNARIGFWRDTHLKLMGDSVYFLQNIFVQDWHFIGGDWLHGKNYFPEVERCGNTMVQIAASGPDSEWETIMQAYFTTITSAKKNIYITSPYLIPDDSILMALKTAALSGVDVRIIVPGKPDKRIVYWASHSYFEELLEAGVKIYKYNRGFIHAKLLLVDGTVASIGTANMDIRSFKFNFEVNALVYDEAVYKRLEKDFYTDIEYSDEVTLEEFINRPLLDKIKESGARLLSPLL
ncbi:MAG: cls [Clostridiales bacterium]|jgi:cardiolipin synthase|nr:cls [Clostridiales bacterium]